MRTRLLVSAAGLTALAVAAPAAMASAPPVLDGRKVKTLTLKTTSTAQDHDSDFVTSQVGNDSRVDCAAPRCAKLPFVYRPAKGVKGGLAFTLSWTIPVSDMDLYVAELGRDGNSQVASCGASAGTSEKIYLSPGVLRPGKTYALIADFYRTPGEAVTGTVSFPGTDTVAKDFPAAVDGQLVPVNCGL